MKSSVLRVILVNLLGVLLVFSLPFLNFSTSVSASQKNEKEVASETVSATSETPPKKEEISSETSGSETPQKEETKSTTETVKETSAKAIKGNIISQYSSPYVASNSYDRVYLKNNTGINISIKKYLEGEIGFSIKKNAEPQVLILHTHATETFMRENTNYFTEDFTSRSQDNGKNMVSVGKIVTEILNSAGIVTLHDTTQHDNPSYTKSYSRSAETVKSYLKKYPSIKVVLDLHRDAVTKENGDKVKLVTQIDGKNAAQVMLVQGSQSGSVTNFPKWEENFCLAVKLQNIMEKNYPTLARPLMLMSKNYNQSLTTGSLLLEFGTDANTLEEVHFSARLVGNCLVELLSGI